ncbi:MAG: 2TM domain-containing protein [Galbitalea sp.]
MDDTDLRAQATKRLKAKRQFWQYIGVWVVVSIVLVAIWFLTPRSGYFWPVWPIVGMGIAALFIGIDAYGPGRRVITDSDVDAEVAKMTRRKGE